MIKTFGNPINPPIMLLHGGGLSWWTWQPLIDRLIDTYYILVPVLKGHGENASKEFIAIDDQANYLIQYLESNKIGTLHHLAGLSIGAQVACQMLVQAPEITHHAILESALVYPIPGINALTVPLIRLTYPLIRLRWFARMQAKALSLPDHLFDLYFEDTKRMTMNSLVNMTKSNGQYSLSQALQNVTIPVDILVGQKEVGIMIRSARALHQVLPNSSLTLLKGLKHGEFSLLNVSEYVKFFLN